MLDRQDNLVLWLAIAAQVVAASFWAAYLSERGPLARWPWWPGFALAVSALTFVLNSRLRRNAVRIFARVVLVLSGPVTTLVLALAIGDQPSHYGSAGIAASSIWLLGIVSVYFIPSWLGAFAGARRRGPQFLDRDSGS